MKKKVKVLLAFFLATMILAAGVASAAIQIIEIPVKDPHKTNSYYITDQIKIKSASIICKDGTENVDVYVVTHKEQWTGGDVLEDVRGNFSTIPNAPTQRKLWDTPQVGKYDIVTDCVPNGKYDYSEKISSETNIDFSVVAKAGTGKAKIGDKSPGNFSWQYDEENPNVINEMLQLSLLAKGEDVTLDNITLQARGTGDDTKIDSVQVYIDENSNGAADEAESLIGESTTAYEQDNGKITIELDYILTDNLTENMLVVYSMSEKIPEGDYGFSIKSIYGTGDQSSKTILFSGPPIDSRTIKVLANKTCIGGIALELIPAIVEQNGKFTAKISNVSGCDNKKALIKIDSCSNTNKEEASCTIKGNECESELVASKGGRYYVCLDKNNDGDFVDIGESSFEDLAIIVPEKENQTIPEKTTQEEEASGENINETSTETVINNTGETVTGGAAGLTEKITESGGFLVLLEVTLLLILFVLVMILFRLKPPSAKEEEEK